MKCAQDSGPALMLCSIGAHSRVQVAWHLVHCAAGAQRLKTLSMAPCCAGATPNVQGTLSMTLTEGSVLGGGAFSRVSVVTEEVHLGTAWQEAARYILNN